MADIRTAWSGFETGGDYLVGALGLVEDDGLETAVVLSLFTDRRALDDDALPDGANGDRRGWWGDAYLEAWSGERSSDRVGSRLWLLHREKQLSSVLLRAREYAEEALEWMVEDGVARRVEVEARIVRSGVLGLDVIIWRPTGTAERYQFERFWQGGT